MAFVCALLLTSFAQAKTIVLTDGECEQMASISADAPKMSWAGITYAAGEYANVGIDLTTKSAFLIKYPLDSIPKGQRITRAEWIVPYSIVSPPAGVRLQVRRILKPWGAGVSHTNRMIRPEKAAWNQPGARGLGQDRAAKATAIATVKNAGEQSFNVTQDVELWYSGAAANHGWILTDEDPETYVRLGSPFWNNPRGYKLRITYEPE